MSVYIVKPYQHHSLSLKVLGEIDNPGDCQHKNGQTCGLVDKKSFQDYLNYDIYLYQSNRPYLEHIAIWLLNVRKNLLQMKGRIPLKKRKMIGNR